MDVWCGNFLCFFSSGGKSSLQVSVSGHSFPFVHLCFFSCNDVAVDDHSMNLLTENNKVTLFKVVGFLTRIFSFTDKVIGARGINCSFEVDVCSHQIVCCY